jgi:L-seryl-tRNA(Ser) seleniumtransferase
MVTPPRPPSIDRLARSLSGLPHPLLVDAARAAVAAGDPGSAPAQVRARQRRLLQPVVNATGVLLHTNLGRAPVAVEVPARYANLELDLATGRRGDRSDHAGALLALACGAEAVHVVNNGAAAVLLVLAALARGRDVVVSRGEEVEIGGGFRIPEVMATSGARLVEVGTTNRTRVDDYRAVIDDPRRDVAVVLKVHRSNYTISGFTEEAPVADLVALGPPVVLDLGSGLLDAATPWLAGGPPPWVQSEPAVRQALEAGAAVVTFSGDKLLGGPQAGIIAGRADLVAACARHPLARALRPGGLVLAALQEIVLAYLRRDGEALPFWQMATVPVTDLEARAAALAAEVPGVEVVATASVTGGGTLPGVEIPSAGLALLGDHLAGLREHDPPVIARVERAEGRERTVLDLRTVAPFEDEVVLAACRGVTGGAA